MSSFASASTENCFSDGYLWAKSLALARHPVHRRLILPAFDGEDYNRAVKIIDYSALYDTMVTDNATRANLRHRAERLMPHPSQIASGDTLQTTDYRGVGTYYAIWLLADVYVNHPSFADVSQLFFSEKDDDLPADEQDDAAVLNGSPTYLDTFASCHEELSDLLEDESLMMALKEPLRYGGDPDDRLQRCAALLHLPAYHEIHQCLRNMILYDTADPATRERFVTDTNLQLSIHKGRFFAQSIHRFRSATDTGLLSRAEASVNPYYEKQLLEEYHFTEKDEDEMFCGFFQEHYDRLGAARCLSPSDSPSAEFPLRWSHDLFRRRCATPANGWHLYLFCHTDEMGYSVPSIFSSAPLGYFANEPDQREVDLQLLPPPFQDHTVCGRLLHDLAEKRMANSHAQHAVNAEEGEDDDADAEDIVEQYAVYESLAPFPYRTDVVWVMNDELRWFSLASLRQHETDEYGEEAVAWHCNRHLSETERAQWPSHHCLAMRSIHLQPRVILARHAQLLREQLLRLVTDPTDQSEEALDRAMAAYWKERESS